MDEARFREAERAFAEKDYRAAAEGFLSAAGGPGGAGNGAAYHMAGNALVRLRKYAHAVTVYAHALKDPEYPKRSQVLGNLGVAYAALGNYSEALAAYDAALADRNYEPRYKALQGKGGALHKMGRFEEAAAAYQEAAADPANTDCGRAYNNLGLTMTALGRPREAIDAYQRALGCDSYSAKGKAAVNMGLIYAAAEMPAEAVRAFEMAVNGYGHQLSEHAQHVYETSRTCLPPAPEQPPAPVAESVPTSAPPLPPGYPLPASSEPVASAAPALVPVIPAAQPVAAVQPPAVAVPVVETDEGGPGREIPPAVVAPDRLPAEPASAPEAAAPPAPPVSPPGEAPPSAIPPVEELESPFFTRTESEMKQLDREAQREARAARRGTRNPWARAASIALGVLLVLGVLAGVFFAGYGYPTQEGTVSGMMNAYKQGKDVSAYWVAAPVTDISKEMSAIHPRFRSYNVDRVDRGPFTSRVRMTVQLEQGAPMRYTISLQREGVGWKVVGIQNDFGTSGTT